MLSEEELKLLADIFAQRYSEISAGILQDMAETLSKTEDLIPAYAKKLQQMYTYGYDVDLITRQLARETGKSMEAIAQMYAAVAQEGMDWAQPFYAAKGVKQIPLEENQALQSILRSAAVTTGNSLLNMSNTTTVGIGSGDAFRPLGTFYKNTIDRAILAVATGTEDYKSVIRQAIKAMGGSGLRVQYESEHTRRMDSAVRQNILDGVSYIVQETARATGEEFGADGVEISAHTPCAPDHLPYQGNQYSYKEFEQLQDSLTRRIGEWNCGHIAYPILLGISPPAYSKAELEEMRRYSAEKITIDGKKYTRYECTQLQRKLETSLRYAKEEKKLYQTFGDADLTREATEKIRTLSNKYVEVSEKAGLPTRAERTRIVSSRLKEKRVVSGGKDGTIKPKGAELKELGSLKFSDDKLNNLYRDERILTGNRKEMAVVYDANGNVLFKQVGESHSVRFSAEQVKQMKGGVATHNHPLGATFSPEDMNLLRQAQLAEIRACTEKGVHIMTQPDMWDTRLKSLKEINKEYMDILQPYQERYRTKVKAGEMAGHEASIKAQQRAMNDFVREFGLDYRFERWE